MPTPSMIVFQTPRFSKNPSQLSIRREYLNGLVLALFVLCSTYWVYVYEYDGGNFSYYFFKADFFYAQFNKIIFPLAYWVLFLSFFLAIVWFRNRSFRKIQVFGNVRLGIFFHLYLLVLTHWGEVLSDFSLFPVTLSRFPGQSEYERFMMALGFFFYYGYGWALLFCKNVENRPVTWPVLPLSFFLPFLIIPFDEINFILMISSGVAFLIWQRWGVGVMNIELNSLNPVLRPLLIFLLSLIYRIWYALYFDSLGDMALGLSADGPTYYSSALAFADSRIEDVDFYHSPFYALYLSFFLVLFGDSPTTLFYSQAFIGSLTPVLIYFIAKNLFSQQIAWIAGLLVATSQLCIHHAVVSHRIDPTLWILPAMILISLKDSNRGLLETGIVFGMLSLSLFYFAQEMLLSIGVLVFFWLYLMIKRSVSSSYLIKSVVGFLIGIILTAVPINMIFYIHYGKWIPLGRYITSKEGQIKVGLSSNLAKEKLEKLGFDFLDDPGTSISVFLHQPIKIIALFLNKMASEALSFILDPGAIHFEPLILNPESFLGAHIQFYLYTAIFWGAFIFLRKKDLHFSIKLLIFLPILVQFVTVTLFIYGTFRYRAPITPLNLLLAAFTIELIFLSSIRNQTIKPSFSSAASSQKCSTVIFINSYFRYLYCMGCLVFILWVGNFKEYTHISSANEQISVKPWITFDSNNFKLIHYNKILINAFVFSQYNLQPEIISKSFQFSFNFCRFLMPGPKPYYSLAVDGTLINSPERIGPGCSRMKFPVQPLYRSGILTLYVYASDDGKIGELKPREMILFNGQKVRIPFPRKFHLSQKMKEYSSQFENYSYGYVKISSPRFVLLSEDEIFENK